MTSASHNNKNNTRRRRMSGFSGFFASEAATAE
jgi:hypothetical protein